MQAGVQRQGFALVICATLALGRLYVTGFGSQKIAVYDTSELETDSFEVSASTQITLSAGGPTAVIIDEAHSRLLSRPG